MTLYNVHAKEPFNQHRIIATAAALIVRMNCSRSFISSIAMQLMAEQVMPRVNAAIGKPADAAMAATAG